MPTFTRTLARALWSWGSYFNRITHHPVNVVMKDFKWLGANMLFTANPDHAPYCFTVTTASLPKKIVGSCFPVSPNTLLTECSDISERSSKVLICDELPQTNETHVEERDPVVDQEWILPKDYTFLRIRGEPYFKSFLLPKAAEVDDPIHFPAIRPFVDVHQFHVILYMLKHEVCSYISIDLFTANYNDEEAEAKIRELGVTFARLLIFASPLGLEQINNEQHVEHEQRELYNFVCRSSSLVEGRGNILKLKDGLMAHDCPIYEEMTGTFGTTMNGTFSCIASCAGLGMYAPGSNYNVAVDINRADFKEEYEQHIVPTLPKDAINGITTFMKT